MIVEARALAHAVQLVAEVAADLFLVAVADSDTPQSLAAKVLAVEHYVYGQVAEWLSKGLVSLTEDQRVNVSGVAQRIFFGGHHE